MCISLMRRRLLCMRMSVDSQRSLVLYERVIEKERKLSVRNEISRATFELNKGDAVFPMRMRRITDEFITCG